MNPEKLQSIPRESESAETKPDVTAFKAFRKRGQRPPGDQEKKEPQIEAEKTISLAREAEEAFSRNDFDAALEKLQELQRAASPERVIGGEYYEQLLKEFERQVTTITKREYSEASGMKPDEYRKIFEPLKERIREIAQREKEIKEGHIPFVIVIKNDVIGGEKAMSLIELDGRKGVSYLKAETIKKFKTIEGIKIPESLAYLVVDVENGKHMLGKTVDEAVKQLKEENRSPLTAEEGIALILQHPEILKDHYMDLPGSRYGDGEVPALWLSHKNEPVLSGVIPGSGHLPTPLWGSASCASRVGP